MSRDASTPAPAPTIALWARHRERVLGIVVVLLLALAAAWLGYQFWRLVFQEPPWGAVDFSQRWRETNCWFAGETVYLTRHSSVYPPASYLMLWPFVGWLDKPAARVLWGAVTLLALWGMITLAVRLSGARGVRERRFLALVLLASYPLGATVGNGQFGILVVLCLLAGLPLTRVAQRSWGLDLCLAGLLLAALVKPTLGAFFFWIVLFAAGSLRPAVLVCSGYAALTVGASLFQRVGLVELIRLWIVRGVSGCSWGAIQEGGIRVASEETVEITSVNLHSVLIHAGLSQYLAAGTLALLALLGLWVWWHRRDSLWHLIGVTALVSRFSTYHGWYDDIILFLPILALLRIARDEEGAPARPRMIAGMLFVAMCAFLLVPGGTYLLGYPWNNAFVLGQTLILLLVLFFLLHTTRLPARP